MKNSNLSSMIMVILIIIIIVTFSIFIFKIINKGIQTKNYLIKDNQIISTEKRIISEGNKNSCNNILIPNLSGITEYPNIGDQNESFASTYYYNQLDRLGKDIYDGIRRNKEKLTSGNYIIKYGMKFNDLLHTEDGKKELNRAFQSAWNAFSYDNMDLFYIDVTKMNLISEYTSYKRKNNI